MTPLVQEYDKKGTLDLNNSDSITIIVQPLKALMEENVETFLKKGLKAVYFGDNVPYKALAKFNYIFGSPKIFISNFDQLFSEQELVERIFNSHNIYTLIYKKKFQNPEVKNYYINTMHTFIKYTVIQSYFELVLELQ